MSKIIAFGNMCLRSPHKLKFAGSPLTYWLSQHVNYLAVAVDEELAVFYKFMGYGFRFMIYIVDAFRPCHLLDDKIFPYRRGFVRRFATLRHIERTR